ncbi:PspC domain-containing protein [Demequina sp.]|uniref:PspC domain-containing protein n=1 Tax=Demequina sp. TaxID=2050685 RepID=UPI003A8722D3
MTDIPPPPKEAAFFTSIRQWGLMRGDNGVIGGVVEGLGLRVGMARVPARLIVVLMLIALPGVTMLAYAAAWGLLPDRRGNIIIQNFGRGVTNVGALLGIAALSLIGLATLDNVPVLNFFGWGAVGALNEYGHISGPFDAIVTLVRVAIPLTLLAGVVVAIVFAVRRGRRTPPPGTGPHVPPPPPATPGTPTDAAPHSEQGPVNDESGDSARAGATPPPPPSGDAAGAAAAGAAAAMATGASAVSTHGAPAPWEPALLPGDPRAGVAPSRGVASPPPTTHTYDYGTAAPQPGAQRYGYSYDPALGGPRVAASQAPPAPPAPLAAPARAPKRRVPGPGKGAWLAFLGVLILSAAVVLAVESNDRLAVSPALAWGACVTVGLGAILVVVALAGRRLGFLGFMSIGAVLLSVAFAGNANEIRDNYDNGWGWWDEPNPWSEGVITEEYVEEVPEIETTPVDLTSEVGDGFSTTYIAGACTTPVTYDAWEEASLWGEDSASMRLGEITADTEIDLNATHTRVTVPSGTSLVIEGAGDTTVVWAGLDIECHNWTEPEWDEYGQPDYSQPSTIFEATNPDAPVLTLTAADGAVIYLEEVTP